MRYQLANHGWPLAGGSRLAPAGTIIDADVDDDWSRLAAGLVPPVNAVALDQSAYDLMVQHYPYNLILTGDDIIRHADPKPEEN